MSGISSVLSGLYSSVVSIWLGVPQKIAGWFISWKIQMDDDWGYPPHDETESSTPLFISGAKNVTVLPTTGKNHLDATWTKMEDIPMKGMVGSKMFREDPMTNS